MKKRLAAVVTVILMLTCFGYIGAYAANYNSFEIIKEVQEELNAEGYDCGSPDGIIGNKTRTQISAFRKDAHIGTSEEIDGSLLWAMGLTDEPYWLPFQSEEDIDLVTDHLTDEYRELAGAVFSYIGADPLETYDVGNYVQYDDCFEFAVRTISDNDSLLLYTAYWDDKWYPVSICNYDTGEYYYKSESFFSDVSVSAYDAAAVQPSLLLSTGTDVRIMPAGEAAENDAYQEADPEPESFGTEYVLNKNTKKFHYPSCSSASDIKPKNRWDYVGTREEIISMGYVPCKRCNP